MKKQCKKLVPLECRQCGTRFYLFASAVLKGQGKHCSVECYRRTRLSNIKPLADRLWEKVDKSEDCWLFTGASTKGYGTVSTGRGRRMEYVHRVSWKLSNGSIPQGLQVLHKCDNPLCVNPSHLFLGNDHDNMRDKVRKGRGNARLMTALGETKPVVDWLEDPRCTTRQRTVLMDRIKRGWTEEQAITNPKGTRYSTRPRGSGQGLRGR